MICKFCQAAGDLTAVAKMDEKYFNNVELGLPHCAESDCSEDRHWLPAKFSITEYAKNMHKFCLGKTHCDCQHKEA